MAGVREFHMYDASGKHIATPPNCANSVSMKTRYER